MAKSKAQIEYERLRRNLLQQRRRAEKSGSPFWFDTPRTPKQEGKKGTSKEYREAAADLRMIRRWFDQAQKMYQLNPDGLPSADEQIIGNLIEGINRGEGGKIITDEVMRFVNRYGSESVAEAIMEMQEGGYLIGKPEVYNPEYGVQYVAEMGKYLMDAEVMTERQFEKFEDRLATKYGDYVPEELQ